MNTRSSSILIVLIIASILFSCKPEEVIPPPPPIPENAEAPSWAADAVWYQIFVERFRNGDPNNDPDSTSVKGSLLEKYPKDWTITPWTQDWYKQEDWAVNSGFDFYTTVQMRRYGGDLQGVLDKINYLDSLGVNAIYFNPINDAPSLHKYDARNYRHVDVNFGPDPEGDRKIIAAETPNDPFTWQMTTADSLFNVVLDSMHAKGMRVILDFSWNHTGSEFWAFSDVRSKGEKSTYKSWYMIDTYDDPNTDVDEFKYKSWYNAPTLPEISRKPDSTRIHGYGYEGTVAQGPKTHIYNVTRKFMDLDGDGDTSDGVDGIRLDVASEMPKGFWRNYRKYVRSINPDFYLIGENWWTSYPDTMMDPSPWVEGDMFDAVMHYQWYQPVRDWILNRDKDVEELQSDLTEINIAYRPQTSVSMMNVAATHDTPRLLTSLANNNQYKYKVKPSENEDYKTGKPGDDVEELLSLFLVHQFTWVGAPHIWMGDEMGMWGADDPDNRKPLIWPDFDFEVEESPAFVSEKYLDSVKFNERIFNTYVALTKLRNDQEALRHADFKFIDLGNNVLAYTRGSGTNRVLVIINKQNRYYTPQLETASVLYSSKALKDGKMPPMSAIVWHYPESLEEEQSTE